MAASDSVCHVNPAAVSMREAGSCGVKSRSVSSGLIARLCDVDAPFHISHKHWRSVLVCTLFNSAHVSIPRCLAALPRRRSAGGGTDLFGDVGVGLGYQET